MRCVWWLGGGGGSKSDRKSKSSYSIVIVLWKKMAEEWNQVPSVVLHEIYSFLTLEEKIRASSTCRQWRHVFYQSVTWNDIHFKIYSRDQNSCNRSQFLASCFGNKLRNAVISFESIDLSCVETMTEVLEIVNKNSNLRSIVLKPSHCTMEISEHNFLEK